MITEHATEWLGFPVRLFAPEEAGEKPVDWSRTIFRLALDWDATMDFTELFAAFLEQPGVEQTPAIIIGKFFTESPEDTAEEVVESLVTARECLPALRGIFLGDLVSEECEVSWINQTDVSPFFTAYPGLEHLRLRGTNRLSLGRRPRHARLRSLTIETGGLPPALLGEVLAGDFPALETLELWLGTPSYGGDVTLLDLQSLLSGKLFPRLRHLGLRDSELADALAAGLAGAPILEQLEGLDLSLGNLGDAGGAALLANPALRRLQRLNLRHHYLSPRVARALQQALPFVDVAEAQDSQTPEEDRYVAVGE